MTSRREFLLISAGAGGAVALSANPLARARPQMPQAPGPKRKLLILGGTGFVGPHQVRYALQRGHQSRSSIAAAARPACSEGRRRARAAIAPNNLDALKGGSGMPSSTSPRRAQRARLGEAVAGLAQRFHRPVPVHLHAFGVLRHCSRVPDGRRAAADHARTRRSGRPTSPHLRSREGARRERGAAACPVAHDDRAPGLIVGPGDDTDRFTYWPVRIARGGEMLAPAIPTRITCRSSTCATCASGPCACASNAASGRSWPSARRTAARWPSSCTASPP